MTCTKFYHATTYIDAMVLKSPQCLSERLQSRHSAPYSAPGEPSETLGYNYVTALSQMEVSHAQGSLPCAISLAAYLSRLLLVAAYGMVHAQEQKESAFEIATSCSGRHYYVPEDALVGSFKMDLRFFSGLTFTYCIVLTRERSHA